MAPPEWIGSKEVWFLALNAVVVAIAFLSRARPSLASPRRGGVTLTRRASSAVLQQRRRSFNIVFSYPSACLSSFLRPDYAAAAAASATSSRDNAQHEPVVTTTTSPIRKQSPSSRPLIVLPTSSPPPAAQHAPEAGDDDGEEGDPNAMSMDEVYALIVAAAPKQPDRQFEREEEGARRRSSEVDGEAEESSCSSRGWFKEDLRQKRLDSIFNYTQMLKQRAQARRQPPVAARPSRPDKA